LIKSPAVSLFQRFWEGCPRNFDGDGQLIKIPDVCPPKNREIAKQTAFYSEISMACLFQPI
jgi:hypothetical protein